ncbi:MAG: fibronectin type III domain-containing protein [Patescibacteria group bacterium]
MDNQNNISDQQNSKNYFLKIIVFIVVILIFIAIVFFFDFFNISKSFGTATLSWTANTESDLAGYKIYYGISKRTGDCPPAGYSENINVQKTTSPDKPAYKIENLDTGKTYYFSITSYDVSGNESCFSAEMSKNILKTKP